MSNTNFFKSWKTTVVGLVILLLFIGDSMSILELDPNLMISVIGALTGLGFVFSKDGDKTHSHKVIGPRPGDRGARTPSVVGPRPVDRGTDSTIDPNAGGTGDVVGPRPGDRG